MMSNLVKLSLVVTLIIFVAMIVFAFMQNWVMVLIGACIIIGVNQLVDRIARVGLYSEDSTVSKGEKE